MDVHQHAQKAHDLLDEAEDLRDPGSGAPDEEIEELERRAATHASVAVAMMLCQQSVCGHGTLQVHDDSGGMCRP